MPVEVAQRFTNTAAIVNGSGQLSRGTPRPVFLRLDVSTLLPARLA
jgi:hypothetical protein